MDFDMGNPTAAGVIEGAARGINEAAKNLFNIQIAKAQLARQNATADADIKLKNAQADKAEAEGSISSVQADMMRDYVSKQKKLSDAQLDMGDATIDTVEHRIQNAAKGYHALLTNTLKTPDGQSYVQQRNLAQGGIPTQNDQPNNTGSPVVNAIMPGVGAQDEQYNQNNPPPMSMAGGGTNMQQPPVGQPAQQPIAQPQNNQQPVAQEAPQEQQLPPLDQVYQGLSKKPFGENQNDLYMKNPNAMEAIKSGQYMVKKDANMIQAENPLSLNEHDRTVLNDVPDLEKAGYANADIFKQLTPGTQSLIKTVGEYRATPAQLTSSFGGGRQKQELVKAVQSFYPKWSDAVYDQRHKALIDFTDPNGANGKAIVSMRQGIQHLDELTQSIDAVSNKTLPGKYGRQIPVLNAPINSILQYVGGDPDILALKQNINAVSEEMTKSWGGSQAGEGRLKNWRDTMNTTNSPQGWSGLLSKTAKLWQAAADTRESMFGLAMGGQKMQDLLGEGVIQPQQQDILNKVKNGYTPGQSQQQNKGIDDFIQKARAANYTEEQIQQYIKAKR